MGVGPKAAGLLGCCLLTVLSACTADTSNPPGQGATTEELRAAPDVALLGGQEYKLETYLWRDFMPTPGAAPVSGGPPLTALVQVVEQHNRPVPSDLKIESLWILNGQEVWASTPADESSPPLPENEIERISRGGPTWETGIVVDAVVGLRQGDGTLVLLRAADQLIQRTD